MPPTLTCPRCGEENPERARVCMICATPLVRDAPGRRERRVVSVLFADVVGFTSRSEALDVEDVQGFLGGYNRLLRGELERFGATVEKFIGDAVMALFGAPVAHEDDAERAVRAGLAIQEAVAAMREQRDAELHVRVGVTTGEALVALGARPEDGEGMAAGDVVNTAARLQAAAPVDGVLVDEPTYRATDRTIVYEAAESVLARGKSQPLAVWRALAPRSLVPEPARVGDLPIVGREAELAHLVSALERSRSEPSTQLVTLVGAPGIGKTKLVEQLGAEVERMPELIRWRRGRSLPYGEGVAFWALVEMVAAEAGILASDPAPAAAAKLERAVEALLPGARDREWVGRHLRALMGVEARAAMGPGDSRVEGFAAWRRFFEAMAEDGPTVLVFEDLHWADDTLLDFVDLLADRAGAVPLTIVCTARPELLERRATWGGGRTNVHTILLSPLSDDDTERLVEELLEGARPSPDTRETLLARAEGNPLYAQEYVRMLRDRGLLVRDDGQWRLTRVPGDVPESVHGIIAARLDTLAAGERALMTDAAVLGRVAWLGAVCAVSGLVPHDADELLHRLERKQLLRRGRRSSVEGEVEFAFCHGLTQEVSYRQIPRVERAEKHERAAAWIERLAGERDDTAELLAHHYATALRLRAQAGEDTAPLVPKARAALVEAGRRAQAVNAHELAARHLAAALELTPADDPSRAQLVLDRAGALFRAGLGDEAMLREALDAQLARNDFEGAAVAAYLLGMWSFDVAGDGQRADAAWERAAEYAARIPYTPVASLIAYEQAFRLLSTGRYADVLAFTERAIARAEAAGDAQGRALVLMWRGFVRVTVGEAAGTAEAEEAAGVLASHAHAKTTNAYHNLAEALVALGDTRRARNVRIQAARWAERFADVFLIDLVDTAQASDAYHAGEWARALELSSALLGRPTLLARAEARWTHGRILLARAACDEVREQAELAMGEAEAAASDEMLFMGTALGTLAAHALGDVDLGARASARFFARWQEVGGTLMSAHALAEVAAIRPEDERVARAVALLTPTVRWRGALDAMVERGYADAAARYREIGSRPLEAQANALAARQAAGAGEEAEACRLAGLALSFYREVGAGRLAADVEELAGTSTSTRPSSTRTG